MSESHGICPFCADKATEYECAPCNSTRHADVAAITLKGRIDALLERNRQLSMRLDRWEPYGACKFMTLDGHVFYRKADERAPSWRFPMRDPRQEKRLTEMTSEEMLRPLASLRTREYEQMILRGGERVFVEVPEPKPTKITKGSKKQDPPDSGRCK